MFSFRALTAAALLASSAVAHFTLDYPTSRGFDDDNEPQFCGGFNSVESPRQPFNLNSGPIWIDSHHSLATVVAIVSTSQNPTSFSDFNTTSNGTNIPALTSYFQVQQGDFCWNVSFAGLNLGLQNGSEVTLQIQYAGPDGNLYQCSDLVLISDYATPANETCTKDAAKSFQQTATGLQPVTTSSGSATSPSSAAASPSRSSGAMIGAEVGSGLLAGMAGLASLLLL